MRVSEQCGAICLSGRLFGIDADAPTLRGTLELHLTGRKSEQRVIVTDPNICSGIEFSSPLSHQDRTGLDNFAGVSLYSEHFRLGVSPISS